MKSKKEKWMEILQGFKYAVIGAFIAMLVLAVLAVLYGLLKHKAIIVCIYNAYYYFGAFVLVISVPMLLKRNRGSVERKVNGMINPFRGLSYTKSEQYITGEEKVHISGMTDDSFWTGIAIILFSLILFIAAALIENTTYH